MTTSYLTVACAADAEIQVKRSRFRCQVRRVESESDAREVVETARKQRWEARHHCSAFVLGPDGALKRSNDDGEPAGTAGAPMLEVLTKRQVSDVVAVVTRYFGGVLLGSGGLVRAYSDAVGAAVEDAGLVRRELRQLVSAEVGHADAGRLENELRGRGAPVLSVDYGTDVTLHVAAPIGAGDELVAQIASLTAGAARTGFEGTQWVDGPM